jgi:hypothetical protein
MRLAQSARVSTATVALVATLALAVAPTALAVRDAPSQPSAIERLIRQEDAKQGELARYDAAFRQHEQTAALDARERSIVEPAFRASLAGGAVAGTTKPAAEPISSGNDFAWGAAALGLAVGVAGMCLLLGLVTLVRHDGRLRSA